jgi:hypothetical protein
MLKGKNISSLIHKPLQKHPLHCPPYINLKVNDLMLNLLTISPTVNLAGHSISNSCVSHVSFVLQKMAKSLVIEYETCTL